MANGADIRFSVVEVFEADGSTSGSTGIVGLTGKANPIVSWGDRGMNDRPVIAFHLPTASVRGGTKDALRYTAQFDIFVEGNSTGLEEQIADRIETVLTQPNLNSTARASPVDVAPYLRARRELPELDEGRNRIQLEYDFWFNR